MKTIPVIIKLTDDLARTAVAGWPSLTGYHPRVGEFVESIGGFAVGEIVAVTYCYDEKIAQTYLRVTIVWKNENKISEISMRGEQD